MKIAPLSGSVAAAVMLLSLSTAAAEEHASSPPLENSGTMLPGTTTAPHCTTPVGNRASEPAEPLTRDEVWALNEAIQDEYKARATYRKVIADFGDVRPFSNIVHAETRHIEALSGLYAKYGIAVPPDEWGDKVPSYTSPKEACAAAVQAEIENGGLYDVIMAKVGKADILRVFTALRDASIQRHLPAFQRCVQGGGGHRSGPRMDAGQGRRGRGAGHGYGRNGRTHN